MAPHLVGNIIVTVLSLVSGAISLGLWFNTSDVNNRRTICSLAMVSAVLLVMEYAWIFQHDPTPRFGDNVPVQWARGVFTGLNLFNLVLGYAVYGSVDYATTAIFLVLATLVSAFWTASMFCYNNDRYWFLAFAAVYCFCLTLLKYLGTRRNKDSLYYLVLLIGSVVGVVIGGASLFGPENINGISEQLQYSLYATSDLVLFPGLFILMMLTQGEDESVISKMKARVADKLTGEAEKLKSSKKNKKNVDPDA